MFERIRGSRREAGEGGFTLIELLVVIIILGILAAVVVFAVGGVGDKGQSASCKIDTRTLRTAQEAYLGRPGSDGNYATNETILVTAGFLSEESQWHKFENVQPDPDGAGPGLPSFEIHSTTAQCGGIGKVNGTSIF